MSLLVPPKWDGGVSSDEDVLDDIPIDDFGGSTLRLAGSPTPAAAAQTDRAISEEAVSVCRVMPPVSAAASIYTPDGGVQAELPPPPLRRTRSASDQDLRGHQEASTFFSTRTGVFETAVERCKQVLLPSDGKFHSAWLLTQIDHWDVERERLVMLAERALLVVRYDFIALRAGTVTRVRLSAPDRLQVGELTYPPASITPRISGIAGGLVSVVKGCLLGGVGHTVSQLRHCVSGSGQPQPPAGGAVSTGDGISFQPRYRRQSGVRISWDCGRPLSLTQNWNPLARDIPFITLTSHSLYWDAARTDAGGEWDRYSVQTFTRHLLELIGREQERPDAPSHCVVDRSPIVISNYVGVLSLLHNASDLGFFKNRGRVSF